MPSTQSLAKTLSQIKGFIEGIAFASEETGFSLAKLKVYGCSTLVTIL